MNDPASTGTAPYLFVSYASADRERVGDIVNALQRAGVDIWVDQHDIAAGANYGSAIGAGIRDCAAVALMCSTHAFASRNVRQEIMLAWKYQRPYVPLLLEPVAIPDDLDYWLEGSQWIELFDQPQDSWLPRVLQAISRLDVVHRQEEPEPPPPPTPGVVPHNLPVTAPLVGRIAEIEAVRELVQGGASRIVTLTGPGGTGKTRLALQVAHELLDDFDEVVFVPLATVSEPRLVLWTIARTLVGSDAGGRTAEEAIVDRFAGRRVLLVLDNFEQVVDAAGEVGRIVEACPQLRVLVSSRIRLGLYAEQEYPLAPLALPASSSTLSLDRLAQVEAIALFVQRAQALRPDFRLTAENAAAVAEICRRLDGLPLAIELAAARTKVLSPQAMLSRMQRLLPLLTGGARDLPARQQTLRGAITWSYDLLNPDEQRCYRQLSVFQGGWTFEAAEAVAGDGEADMLLLLERLLEHNLIRQRESPGNDVRFDMLATIREYGYEQLEATGEVGEAEERHARYVADLAAEAEPNLEGPDAGRWLDRIEAEYENLRAAVEWYLARDRFAALRLTLALYRFWYMRGYLSEPCRWLEILLDSPEQFDPKIEARALRQVGAFLAMLDRPEDARQALEGAVARCREANDSQELAYALNNTGAAAYQRGDFDLADAAWSEALEINRALDNDIGRVLANLGNLSNQREDYQSAIVQAEEAIEFARRSGDQLVLLFSLTIAGSAYLSIDAIPKAAPLYTEALVRNQRLGDRLTVIDTLENITTIITKLGPPEVAARIAGATHAARLRSGSKRSFDENIREDHTTLQQQLGEARWAELWAAGQQLSLEDASAEALDIIAMIGIDDTDPLHQA